MPPTLADNRGLSRRPGIAVGQARAGSGVLAGSHDGAIKEVRRMAVQDVTVVSIPVSDQERAKAFYVDTLGLELVRDDDSVPGIRWIQVTPKAGTTSLTLVTWFESMLPGSLQGLVLSSENLQADYEALRAAGVQFQGPPQQQPWATEAVLFDPDGNSLVLQQA
jgi:catechol 2,3-dioxygenase-like lactoylglutathione lyase family enzyme